MATTSGSEEQTSRSRRPSSRHLYVLMGLLTLELLYFLPMAWGWHSVPFHLFSPRFTGVEYQRSLPPSLRHMPGNDATAVIMDYPNEYYTALRIRHGAIPWWNPDIGMGRAWLGNAQVHPFSPLLLPLVIHPSPWTYTLQFLLGSLICFLGAFWLFRLMDLSLLPAFAGSALWTWNPFTASSYIMSSVWAYWWLPLALAGILFAVRKRHPAGWFLAAAALALMVLCGQPETALILGEMCGILLICMVAGRAPVAGLSPKWLAGGLLLTAVLAAALSAAQWVPILEVVRSAVWYKSQGITSAARLTHPMSQFLNPLSDVFLAPALLGSVALLAGKRMRWEVAGFGCVLFFSLGFSQPAVFETLPYRLLRLNGLIPPLHGVELACVPVAALCALGLQTLCSDGNPSPPTLQRLGAATLCIVLTAWSLDALWPLAGTRSMPAGWLSACALGFLFALFASARKSRGVALGILTGLLVLYPLATQQFLYPYFSGSPQPDWQAFLHMKHEAQDPAGRFWASSSQHTRAPYLIPNLGLLSEIADVRSSSVLNPPGSDVFSHGWGPGGYISHLTYTFSDAGPELLRFLGVSRIAVAAPSPGPLFQIYRLVPGPRAFVVRCAQVESDDAAALEAFKRLLSRGFVHEVATVEGRAGGILSLPSSPPVSKKQVSTVTWIARRSSMLRLSVNTPSDGLLVVTDAYAPLWKARVDGIPAPVVKADVMFRGIPVSAGNHTVEMRYDTHAMNWGLWLSLLAWLTTAGWFLVRRRFL